MSTGWVFGDSAAQIISIPFDNVTGYLDFDGNAYGSASLYPQVLEYFASTRSGSDL
jgi:L-ascorbate oxidase